MVATTGIRLDQQAANGRQPDTRNTRLLDAIIGDADHQVIAMLGCDNPPLDHNFLRGHATRHVTRRFKQLATCGINRNMRTLGGSHPDGRR